jgi:hypothetical protein
MVTETEYRQAWRAALAELLAKAKTNLPLSGKRPELGAELVLRGCVTRNADGSATVGSLTDPAKSYLVKDGTCDCKDYPAAPNSLCKHRIADAMERRLDALVPKPVVSDDVLDRPLPVPSETAAPPAAAPVEQASPPVGPLPEAPVSITLKGFKNGQEIMVTLRGTEFAAVKDQVEATSQWLDARKEVTAPAVELCPEHGVPWRHHVKGNDEWDSHPLNDGSGKHHRRPDPDRPQQRGSGQRRGYQGPRGPR